MKKYKYRFKTEQEFIDSFSENWKNIINGTWESARTTRTSASWWWCHNEYGNYDYIDKRMDNFFGRVFQITIKDKIEKLERGEKIQYHYHYNIHKDMLVCLFVPNYKPKRIIRKI